MRTKRLKFDNDDGYQLSARLELPVDTHPKAYALFAHCFTCNKNLAAVKNISRALTSEGIGVLRFDFTGLGESEGEFADTTFTSNVEDLIAAAKFMKENFEAPSIIIGHSLGGAAVIMAAKFIDSIKAVATIGAPAEPLHVSHHFDSKIEELEEEGIAEVFVGGRPFKVKRQFLEDIRTTKLSTIIRELKKPILILHSPHDKIVGIENAAKIYGAAFHPKSFVSLDGADHLLSDKRDSLYTGNVIASWAVRYLDIQEEVVKIRTREQVAVQTGEEKYTTQIKAGRHLLLADEPSSVGGNDFGPTPYDLLLSSLGACTSMTLRMYADRKKWDLKTITVHLSHDKRHAADCEDCDNPKSKVDFIERTIELEGDLTDKQRERLLQIADRCPVHRTLHNEIRVQTVLA